MKKKMLLLLIILLYMAVLVYIVCCINNPYKSGLYLIISSLMTIFGMIYIHEKKCNLRYT